MSSAALSACWVWIASWAMRLQKAWKSKAESTIRRFVDASSYLGLCRSLRQCLKNASPES